MAGMCFCETRIHLEHVALVHYLASGSANANHAKFASTQQIAACPGLTATLQGLPQNACHLILSVTSGRHNPVKLRVIHTYPLSQHVHGSINIHYVAAAHYLALSCGEQERGSERLQNDVAMAGLRCLAAVIVHVAQMDSHASVAPESLATTEAANSSVTGKRQGRIAVN